MVLGLGREFTKEKQSNNINRLIHLLSPLNLFPEVKNEGTHQDTPILPPVDAVFYWGQILVYST